MKPPPGWEGALRHVRAHPRVRGEHPPVSSMTTTGPSPHARGSATTVARGRGAVSGYCSGVAVRPGLNRSRMASWSSLRLVAVAVAYQSPPDSSHGPTSQPAEESFSSAI